jgi:phenylalanyl-tRNA synthetase beta chain
MANVKFPRKEFEKEVGKINKKMEEKISLFGTPLESINDKEVEIEIFPDRPDLLSFQGYIRSFKSFLGKKQKSYKTNKPGKNYEVEIDKSLKNIRPYTACCIVKNLNLSNENIKEIIDVQEKIHKTLGRERKKVAIGIYPLENIKLPIKFTAKTPEEIKFQPLESQKEMTGNQILRQHPTGKEYKDLLKNLNKYPVFIDAKNDILSMPPIINSEKTGKISTKTREVFIECSGFGFPILSKTLNILVTMLADMGGKIYEMKLKPINKTTPNLNPEKIKIDIKECNKLLGLNLNKKQVNKLLKKMGLNYIKTKNRVEIPPWRTDILHPVDIYEDIAIAYGYNNFKPEIPKISTTGKQNKKEIIKRKISRILFGLKLTEISTYNLLSKEDLKKLREKRNKIKVEDSKTENEILRPEMLPSLLKVLSENINKEYPQRIFEIGTCFSRDEKEETGIKEKEKLAIAITPGNFTEIKQIFNYLFKMLDLKSELKEKELHKHEFIPGRVGEIIFDKEIGYLGEVHPSLLKSWNLKMPLSYLEIDLEEIIKKLE